MSKLSMASGLLALALRDLAQNDGIYTPAKKSPYLTNTISRL